MAPFAVHEGFRYWRARVNAHEEAGSGVISCSDEYVGEDELAGLKKGGIWPNVDDCEPSVICFRLGYPYFEEWHSLV